MPRTHVGFRPTPDARAALDSLPGEVTTSHDPSGQERAALLADVAGCDAVVTLLTQRVDKELLDAAGPGLRVVANVAVGHDNIDLDACRQRNVIVTTTPGVLDQATADLAFALALATARRVVEADAFIRAGNAWTWSPDLFVGLDVTGATLGIVGFGRIGQQVARRAAAFDMRVLATPSRSGAAAATELGVETMPLDRLLGESDIVSLHCPLTPETRHLIGAEEFALMKPEAILVNTARGPIVDEAALAAALIAGQIGGAGLDVFEHEPDIHHDLVGRPDVVLLPHIGSAGRRTRLRMLELALDNVRAVLAGETPPTPV
ncbi:D-glycerate dehydrogenase [Nocardioides sp. InS609-2]|uniref:2-hydroxyacid dehydrogenase n=1 Tax=Nocardioides sp. InS609-2 TaxID=2760705 RepID=UPI0020BF044D|nr:D-glycerate dehydrogenase [Nocardioides sp. InS609-2]